MRKKNTKHKRKAKTPRAVRKPKVLKAKVEPRQIMVSFFDLSTVMAKPWAKAGYLCYCIDLQHPPGEHVDPENENIIRVQSAATGRHRASAPAGNAEPSAHCT